MPDRTKPDQVVTASEVADFYATQDAHARRCYWEARVAAVIWLLACLYCCGTIATLGYVPPTERPAEPTLILGFPLWVFVGLVVPWFVLIGVIWSFARWVLRDDEPLQEFPLVEDSPHHPAAHGPPSLNSTTNGTDAV